MERPADGWSPVEYSLVLPVWGRAMFSARHLGFSDPFAEQILPALQVDEQQFAASLGDYGVAAFGLRAMWVDRQVRSVLDAHPSAQVVNLGAGLDTLFERIDNGRCRSIAVDYPRVVEARERLLPGNERHENVPSDLLDPRWLVHLARTPTVVVLCGVTMYLTDVELPLLLRRVAERVGRCIVVFDALSPFAVRLTNWRIRKTGLTDALVSFGLRRVGDVVSIDEGWSVDSVEGLFAGTAPIGPLSLRARMEIQFARWTSFTQLVRLRYGGAGDRP